MLSLPFAFLISEGSKKFVPSSVFLRRQVLPTVLTEYIKAQLHLICNLNASFARISKIFSGADPPNTTPYEKGIML